MRMDSLCAGFVCLALFGCANEPRLLDEFSDKTSVLTDRIVIRASTSGSTCSEYDWVLEKKGKSHGTLHFIPNADDAGTTTHYEFQSGVYEECLAKLEETRFFRMKSVLQSGPPMMAPHPSGTATIEVHYHGRKHVVTQFGEAEIDDGFNKMWLFFGDVLKRSKVVVPEPKFVPAPFLKRTGSGTRGIVAGLSLAEPCIEISLTTETRGKTRWTFCKNGECTGTISTGVISPAPPPEYELPPETFEECRRLLESTRFMDMKQPANFSEKPLVTISAGYNGRYATVYTTTATNAPEGFTELQRFLENLPKRAKVLSSSP